MSQSRFSERDTAQPTTPGLIERIAKETAKMGNRRAWPEILTKLRAAGRSARAAHELRNEVWQIRKWISADALGTENGGTP